MTKNPEQIQKATRALVVSVKCMEITRKEEPVENVSQSSLVCFPEPGSSNGVAEGSSTIESIVLTHLVSLAGDVALQQLVHLELSISTELRRRRVLGEEQQTKEHAASNTKAQRDKVRIGGV